MIVNSSVISGELAMENGGWHYYAYTRLYLVHGTITLISRKIPAVENASLGTFSDHLLVE